MNNTRKMLLNFKDKIAVEASESRELVHLLKELRIRDLTEDEKLKVHTQLVDIPENIPVLMILALPGIFLTLPVLLRLLPSGVLPSVFHT